MAGIKIDTTVCVSRDEVFNILDAELNHLYSEELAAPELNSHSFEAVAAVKRVMDAVNKLPCHIATPSFKPMSEEEKTRMRIKMWESQRNMYQNKMAEALARIELINKKIEMMEQKEEKDENKD